MPASLNKERLVQYRHWISMFFGTHCRSGGWEPYTTLLPLSLLHQFCFSSLPLELMHIYLQIKYMKVYKYKSSFTPFCSYKTVELRGTRHKGRNSAVSWTGQYNKCVQYYFKFTPVGCWLNLLNCVYSLLNLFKTSLCILCRYFYPLPLSHLLLIFQLLIDMGCWV